MRGWVLCWVLTGWAGMSPACAGDHHPSWTASAARGREAVRRPMNPPFWSLRAYATAWKRWGLADQPAAYARAFRDRYGLHEAPYDNGGLPLGFNRPRGLLGLGQGLGNDCLLCHAGAIAGQTIIGLGNTALDMQALYEELAAADGLDPVLPLPLSNVRGTTEAANFAAYFLQFRDTALRHRLPVKFPLCTTLCEDVPAWWHFQKKRTIYHLGGADSRSVRTMMPFLLVPTNSADYIRGRESDFADIRAYLLTIQPPRYPFAVDRELAAQGKPVFERRCSRCHGTYGPGGHYPNKIVPLDQIGTDGTLAQGFAADAVEHYLKSWFAQEHGPAGEPYHGLGGGGYQAPPLDGLWATPPYFHNGSVPTVYHVLRSQDRPKIFTRSFRAGVEDYDARRLGWKITVLDKTPDPSLPAIERRKVYDTSQPGRGNAGHTFGDKLTEEERLAVIEYLKTL